MPLYTAYIQTISMAMVSTLIAIFILNKLATSLGLIDHPGGRKTHARQTPLIGGIAIFIGLTLAAHFHPVSSALYEHVLMGSFVLLLIGALDDRFEVSPKLRMLIQVSAILFLMVMANTGLYYIGSIFYLPDMYLGLLAFPLTVVLMLGFINAVNMLDGQDGLAGGVVFSQVTLLALISYVVGEHALSLLLVSLLAVLSVFLYFNLPMPWRKHAKIFLGDSGSNFLAYFIAWSVIYLSQASTIHIKPMTLIWIVAFPFFDMTSACLKRSLEKRSWADAGHDHIHHLLRLRGMSSIHSTLVIILISTSYGLLGLWLTWHRVSEGLQSLIFLACYGGYLTSTYRLGRKYKVSQTTKSEGIFTS